MKKLTDRSIRLNVQTNTLFENGCQGLFQYLNFYIILSTYNFIWDLSITYET